MLIRLAALLLATLAGRAHRSQDLEDCSGQWSSYLWIQIKYSRLSLMCDWNTDWIWIPPCFKVPETEPYRIAVPTFVSNQADVNQRSLYRSHITSQEQLKIFISAVQDNSALQKQLNKAANAEAFLKLPRRQAWMYQRLSWLLSSYEEMTWRQCQAIDDTLTILCCTYSNTCPTGCDVGCWSNSDKQVILKLRLHRHAKTSQIHHSPLSAGFSMAMPADTMCAVGHWSTCSAVLFWWCSCIFKMVSINNYCAWLVKMQVVISVATQNSSGLKPWHGQINVCLATARVIVDDPNFESRLFQLNRVNMVDRECISSLHFSILWYELLQWLCVVGFRTTDESSPHSWWFL